MRRGQDKPNWPYTLNRDSDQAKTLLAWWPGAQVGSSFQHDLGPHSLHATLNGFPSPFTTATGWTAGKDGGRGAILFDGGGGGSDYCALTAAKTSPWLYFTATQPFTVSFWTKIVSQPTNTHGFMCGVRVISAGNGWYVYWEKAGSRFLFGYQGLNGNYHFRYSTGSLALNTWYHVTCRRDATNTIGGTQIFINGVLDAGSTDTPGTPDDFSPIASPSFSWGNDANNTGFPSNAVMEDLCICGRAMPEVYPLYDRNTRWQKRWQPSRTARSFKAISAILPKVPRRRMGS
jgi:hypothetical protein